MGVASIGGFLFGYDTGIIAGAQLFFKDTWPDIDEVGTELIVSLAQLGALVGSLIGGPLSDIYGRKPVLILGDIMFTLGALIMMLAPTIAVLMVGRVVVGLGVGLAAYVVPVYLSEISPVEVRGTVVSFNILVLCFGQFISSIIAYLLGRNWRLMLGLAGVPSLIQLICMFFMPES